MTTTVYTSDLGTFDIQEYDKVIDELVKMEAERIRSAFFDKYAIYNVEGEGYVAVLRGFEEFIENGTEVIDVDELDSIMVTPPKPIVLEGYGDEDF